MYNSTNIISNGTSSSSSSSRKNTGTRGQSTVVSKAIPARMKPPSGNISDGNGVEMDEKRRRRLERNRESARECRKRKKDKLMQLKQSIARLETDNMQLRLKLQIGPESIKQQQEEAANMFNKLGVLISEGASDAEIKKSVTELQERFADYGRDKRSAVSFHITQLQRCLQPTQTTKTILWLMNNFPTFYESDGRLKINPQDVSDEISSLWYDLHQTLNPSIEQCRRMFQLATQPTDSDSSESALMADLDKGIDGSELLLKQLDEIMLEKNDSLDNEMSQLQQTLSASQIAKFLVWINNNPTVMQMLDFLWPHLSEEVDM